MSTKSTISYGKIFHFYHEAGDNQHVHLELEGTQFEAGYNRVIVPIPIHIWEVIRQEGAADLSLAGLTDPELDALAEEQVDKLIADYNQAKAEGSHTWFYLGADRPRDEQIADRRESLLIRRKQQREIAAAIEEVRTYDPRSG